MKIKLYIEGGGDGRIQDMEFRAGWTAFFEKAGLKDLRKMPRPIRCGGRKDAFNDFCTAVATRKPDELPLLLVDSEDFVEAGHDVWQHLKARDKWTKPKEAGKNDAFLMITCMETWFLADREALKAFFKGCWNDKALPKWPDLEKVGRKKALAALDKATANCAERQYAKGKVSFDLLKVIDPAVVEKTFPSAKALLDRLRKA